MSAISIRQKIGIIETALKDAGVENVVHAIIDVLKEITGELERLERAAIHGTTPRSEAIPSVPPSGGRKIRS